MKISKILIVGPFPDPIDGCSFANQTLYRNFLKKNIRVDRINTNSKLVSSKQGSKFSIKKAFSFIGAYFHIFKIFNSKVVYFTPGQTFFGVLKYAPFFLFCILLNRPYVIHVHGNHLGKHYKELNGLKKVVFKYFVSHASAGIVLSKSLRPNFRGLLQDESVFVVENFVDDQIINNSKDILKKKDKLRIIYLSNLMSEKGILELLDALVNLKKKGVDFYAEFAGKIENEIENKINDKLKFIGECGKYLGIIRGMEKSQALIRSNIFILPTYYTMEGQPISLLEGMATGNIIITTKHAGIPDIVGETNGYFVEKKSTQSIVDSLEVISKDLQKNMMQFSEHNIKYAAENFSESVFADKILNIMESLQS